MPAVNTAIVARDALAQLTKRNFATEEPGVILVFVIVGLVAIGLTGVFISKKLAARKASKQQF